MTRQKDIQTRIDLEFDIAIKKIGAGKLVNGTSKKAATPREVTAAMLRHEGFEKLKEDLIMRPFKDE